MERRIRDRLQVAGASDEYIMSRLVEASIHKPTDEERRKGLCHRRFLDGPEDYIKESITYLRTIARCLEVEEPSLISIQHSIDMVILHWVQHDDERVWRAPVERLAMGLVTTFFPEVLRFELIHLYDEDTARKFSHRTPLEASPLAAAMDDRFDKELQRTFGDGTDLIWEGAEVFEGLPDATDFEGAARVQAGQPAGPAMTPTPAQQAG